MSTINIMDDYYTKRIKTLPMRILDLLHQKGLVSDEERSCMEYPSEEDIDRIHWSDYI